MSSRNRSGSNQEPYLSRIAQKNFQDLRGKNQGLSPSKMNQDQNATINSSLENSNQNLIVAQKYDEPTVPSIDPQQAPQNHRDVQLNSMGLPYTLRSIKKAQSHCVIDDDDFKRTKSRLLNANFSHHDPEMCVCTDCDCGRHLCKLHVVKPDLHINSIYRGDFNSKRPIGLLSYRPRSSKKSQSPHIDMKSIYGKEFAGLKGNNLERPHPEDQLGVKGAPLTGLTTYGSGFPGFSGPNQYIKPTQNSSLHGLLPFNGNTVYRHCYVPKRGRSTQAYRLNDTLRVGLPWMGSTTYRENYRQPLEGYNTQFNPEYRRDQSPSYAHQFETTYKNEFMNKVTRLCPAKIQLESKSKGRFTDSKNNFNDNSDFKSMNPEFHAIATSKHSYV